MTDYKFKVGDKGKTGDGLPYEVMAVDHRAQDRLCLLALVFGANGKGEWNTYRIDGAHPFGQRGGDLMPPTRTVWANFYADGSAFHHATEAKARFHADSPEVLATAVPVEIPATT